MKGKVSIFLSGKLISVGTNSPEHAQQDLDTTVKILVSKRLIKPVKVEAVIRNIVTVQNIGTTVALEELSLVVGGIYEPEQIPGLILRQDKPKVTYLVFSSGKIVIAGSRSLEDVHKAASKIKAIIDRV